MNRLFLFIILLLVFQVGVADVEKHQRNNDSYQWLFPNKEKNSKPVPLLLTLGKFNKEATGVKPGTEDIESGKFTPFPKKENLFEYLEPYKKINFEPRITSGVMYHAYEGYFMGKLKGNTPFWGLGLLTHYDRWIADIYAQSSFTSVDSDSGRKISLETGREEGEELKKVKAKPIENIIESHSYPTFQSRNIEREDYSINVGYNIINNLWIFGGYRWGETAIDGQASIFTGAITDEVTPAELADLVPTELPRIDHPESNHQRDAATTLITEARIKTKGPFIGVMYSWKVSESNEFGINVALTRLNSDYYYTNSHIELFDKKFISDESQGWEWAFGIHWNAPITNITRQLTLRYTFSLNAYQHKMDVEGDTFEKVYEVITKERKCNNNDCSEKEQKKWRKDGLKFDDFSVIENIFTFRAGLLLQWW